MPFQSGPLFQKPGEELDWIISVEVSPFTITQFIGLSAPVIGVTLMWGHTGNDRDGHLLGGTKRWYTIDGDGRVRQHFRFLVKKDGGSSDDFFNAQFHTF